MKGADEVIVELPPHVLGRTSRSVRAGDSVPSSGCPGGTTSSVPVKLAPSVSRRRRARVRAER